MSTEQNVISIEGIEASNHSKTSQEKGFKKTLKLEDGANGFDIFDIAGMASAISSLLSSISVNKKYVVDISPGKLKAVKNGELKFTVRKDGRILAQTRSFNENGKGVIDSNLTMHPESSFDVSSLMSSISSICMQAQLQQIEADLADIKETCAQIEKGQHNDRVGLVIGGRDSIEQALAEEKVDSHLLALGISTLNNARGQLGMELMEKCKSFKEIPQNEIGQFFFSFKNNLNSMDEKAEEIWECYYLYTQATAMVAYAYSIDGKVKAAEKTIKEGESFVSAIDFSRVKTIEHSHKNQDFSDEFFNKPLRIFRETRELLAPYENVSIEVSGRKLLGAVNAKVGKDETESK